MTSAANVRSQLIHSVIFIFISLCSQCNAESNCSSGKALDYEHFHSNYGAKIIGGNCNSTQNDSVTLAAFIILNISKTTQCMVCFLLVRGTTSWCVVADRRRCRELSSATQCKSLARYSGAVLLRQRNMSTASRYLMRSGTRNQ